MLNNQKRNHLKGALQLLIYIFEKYRGHDDLTINRGKLKTNLKDLAISLMTTGLILFTGCREQINTLSVNQSEISFEQAGGNSTIEIRTDADSWEINSTASDWLELSSNEGTEKSATVSLNVGTKTITARKGTLTITAGNATPVQVKVSQPASEYLYDLAPDHSSFTLEKTGGSASIRIDTDAPQWKITNRYEWLQLSQTSGNSGSTTVNISVPEYAGTSSRTAILVLSADYAPTTLIYVTQREQLYPSYNTSPLAPDATGMSSNAVEIASKINLGWNVGNSLEAIGGETAWGNPKITKALIDLVKNSGFNAIRIPCSFNQYMANSTTAQLSGEWLDRVKEVVQYCVDDGLYVILNIHWDGGWLENNCTPAKKDDNNSKQQAFWEQIATNLRDFDEHVMFASANEPNVDDASQMAVLFSYHQTFIDAVRSTGGRNSYRVLVIQGPSTDIEKTNMLMQSLPSDQVTGRMMVEIHYYTPWNFCGLTEDADWGKMFYYWGNGYHSATDPERNATWGEETTVNDNFALMKSQFIDKGIPVVLGEYSVLRRSSLSGDALTKHLASRAYFLKYVTRQAKVNGILPFYWDNGGTENGGCGIFYRKSLTVFDQQALDALLEGAAK